MQAPAFESKIVAPDDAPRVAATLTGPVVFTNGVFDLLHRGHVTYLARARASGGALIVALNDDASVRRLGKGSDRPVNRLEDRLAVIAALESVSMVTWFPEDTPLHLIQAISPQVLVKGGDWPVDRIVGAQWVRQRGGEVLSIAFEHERSTTAMLQRIRASLD
jgi:rfaE bifunctional protein nucleotidyltransferase chain/domain